MNKRAAAVVLCVSIIGKGNAFGVNHNNILTSKILPISAALGIGGYFVCKNFGLYHYHETCVYELGNFLNKVEIDDWIGDINISYEDISNPVIKYYQTKKINYKISDANGIFKIKRTSEWESNNRGIQKSTAILKVIIPKKNKMDFDISGCIGNLSLKSLESTYIKVNHNCGNVYLKNVTSDKIDIKVGSGSIDIENLNAKNINIKNSFGNIVGSLIGSKKDYMIDAYTRFGNCNLENSSSGSRTLNVSITSGDIDISFDNKNLPR